MTPEAKPLRVSWTKVREHEECKAKGYLKTLGMKPKQEDIRNYFPGTVIDRVMRRWLEAAEQSPGAMAAMVDEVLDREESTARETGDGVVKWRDASDRTNIRVWCKEAVTRLEPVLFEHVVPHEYQTAVRFEVPFTIVGAPAPVVLVGEMDLLVRNRAAGWVRVKDLKGTSNNDYWRKTYPQLVFYELAARVLTGQWPAESWLIQPMCDRPWLPFVFTMEHRTELAGRIVRYCEDQWRGVHPPKDEWYGCDRCEVRRACPKFAPPTGNPRMLAGISAGRL